MSSSVEKGGAEVVIRDYPLQRESRLDRAEAREELHPDAPADHNRTAV
jgi:hypothetical protein